jgi:hypothetical protein
MEVKKKFFFLERKKKVKLFEILSGSKSRRRRKKKVKFQVQFFPIFCLSAFFLPLPNRVARWFVFNPKIPIWVNFGGP